MWGRPPRPSSQAQRSAGSAQSQLFRSERVARGFLGRARTSGGAALSAAVSSKLDEGFSS